MITFHDRRTGKITPIAPSQLGYDVDEALGHLRANDVPLLTGEGTTVNQYSRPEQYEAASDAVNSSADGEMKFSPSARNNYSIESIKTSYGFSRAALKKKADQLELDAQAKGK